MAIGLAALIVLAAVVFRELSVFLLRIEGSSHSFGPSVFTGWNLKVWDTADLMAAAGPDGVWTDNKSGAGPFVSWHLTVDLVFPAVLAYALLQARMAVAGDRRRSWWLFSFPRDRRVAYLPLLYGAFDYVETIFTFGALHCRPVAHKCKFEISQWQAVALHSVSDLKWVFLVLSIVTIVGYYFWPGAEGNASWQASREFRQRLAARNRAITGAPVGAWVIVSLLVVLLALPGGSALDQIPDIVRAQVDAAQDGHPAHVLWSGAALLLFMATLLVLLHRFPAEAIDRGEDRDYDRKKSFWTRHHFDRRDGQVVLGAAVITGGLMTTHGLLEGRAGIESGLAPVLVVVAVVVLSVATARFRHHVETHTAEVAPERSAQSDAQAERVLLHRSQVRSAILLMTVPFAAALSLVRAELPTYMLPGDPQPAEFRILVVATVLAVVLPWCAGLGRRVLVMRPRPAIAWVGALVLLAEVIGAVALTVHPRTAERFGALATVMVALGAWLSVVAAFSLMREKVTWERTRDLRFAQGTPWLALTTAAWVLASILDSTGGYHDTRTETAPSLDGMAAGRTRTLDQAFDAWAAQFGSGATAVCDDVIVDVTGQRGYAPANNTRVVPLVLVAAPGGGGKAAYWTALGMDRTFSSGGFCPQSLFAASGVSGGSVGLTAALAMPPASDQVEDRRISGTFEDGDDESADVDQETIDARDKEQPEDAEDALRLMTGEGPISQTIAALLLRDLPQPLTTLRGEWRDRAAVLEDAWADAAPDGVFDGEEGVDDKALPELGRDWWTPSDDAVLSTLADTRSGPVLILNSSSVNDGCRVLIANVRDISSGRRGCLAAPITATETSAAGSVSGSIDILDGLLPAGQSQRTRSSKDETEGSYCGPAGSTDPLPKTLRATTGALLSARFPYVTPAGAVRRCLDPRERNLNEDSELSASLIFQARKGAPETSAPAEGEGLSDTSYVVDGGYLENTGILSLLQLWESLEPRVAECNRLATGDAKHQPAALPTGNTAASDEGGPAGPRRVVRSGGCPRDAQGHLWVEPWFVMLENHYRSRVAPSPSPNRPHELAVPVTTAGKKGTTLGFTPLEQAMAIAISRTYAGLPVGQGTGGTCNRFVRLAPLKLPVIEAPLGWVLAEDTRDRMREAMVKSWKYNLTSFGSPDNLFMRQRCSGYESRVEIFGRGALADDARSQDLATD